MDWIPLTSSDQFEKLLKADDALFAVFKHSTRCSISAAAKNRLEKDWKRHHPNIPLYYLDLLSYRELSNQIANVLEVEHQSPQILLVRDGRCIYQASHLSISPAEVAGHI